MAISDGQRGDVTAELSGKVYTVEQLDTSDVDRFNYELNFLPQELPGVKITSKD